MDQKTNLVVKYSDQNSQELIELQKIFTGTINQEYDVNRIKHLTKTGYNLKLIKGQTKGKFTKETKEIIFEYEKTQNITDLIPTGFENITYIIYITIILLILFIFRKRIIK